MHLTKTPDVDGLVYSPWEMRPGTNVVVTYTAVNVNEVTWNSGESITVATTGTVIWQSVKTSYPLDEDDITIGTNTVTVNPIYKGILTLYIYSREDKTASVAARAAITETDWTYYNDWFYDQFGNSVPMTIVPLALPGSEIPYQSEDFTVAYNERQRGISVLNGDTWTCTEVGTLKMIDNTDDFSMSRNLLRKGLTEVRVPVACQIEPKVRDVFQDGGIVGKIVKIDLQDWKDDTTREFKGILWHRDKLYTLTNEGMYAFDRFGEFDDSSALYSGIVGNDLTYTIDDKFLVTEGSTVKEYRVRHDYVYINYETGDLIAREADPTVDIEE